MCAPLGGLHEHLLESDVQNDIANDVKCCCKNLILNPEIVIFENVGNVVECLTAAQHFAILKMAKTSGPAVRQDKPLGNVGNVECSGKLECSWTAALILVSGIGFWRRLRPEASQPKVTLSLCFP